MMEAVREDDLPRGMDKHRVNVSRKNQPIETRMVVPMFLEQIFLVNRAAAAAVMGRRTQGAAKQTNQHRPTDS